jgi:DNA-binding XRE family transcriptional regulator
MSYRCQDEPIVRLAVTSDDEYVCDHCGMPVVIRNGTWRHVGATGTGLLRRARLDRGITQTELARRAGVNPSSVSDAERNENPSVHILDRYGRALGLTLVIYYHDPEGRRAIE